MHFCIDDSLEPKTKKVNQPISCNCIVDTITLNIKNLWIKKSY